MFQNRFTIFSISTPRDSYTPSALAVLETFIAVAIGFAFAQSLGIYSLMFGASFAAFFFLLRSEESIRDGQRFFDKLFLESYDPEDWLSGAYRHRRTSNLTASLSPINLNEIPQSEYPFEMLGPFFAITFTAVGSMLISTGLLGEFWNLDEFSAYFLFSLFTLNIAFFAISLFDSFSVARAGAFWLFLSISLLNIGLQFSISVVAATVIVFLAIPFTLLAIGVSLYGAGISTALPSILIATALWVLAFVAFTKLSLQSQLSLATTIGAPILVGVISLALIVLGLHKLIVAPAMVIAIAARALVARFIATLFHLRKGIKNFPSNWVEQTFCVDCTRPPELIPGLPYDHPMNFSSWVSHVRRPNKHTNSQRNFLLKLENLTIVFFCFSLRLFIDCF